MIVYPSYGDNGNAYTTQNGHMEYLLLRFEREVKISSVNIFETYCPGGLVRISAYVGSSPQSEQNCLFCIFLSNPQLSPSTMNGHYSKLILLLYFILCELYLSRCSVAVDFLNIPRSASSNAVSSAQMNDIYLILFLLLRCIGPLPHPAEANLPATPLASTDVPKGVLVPRPAVNQDHPSGLPSLDSKHWKVLWQGANQFQAVAKQSRIFEIDVPSEENIRSKIIRLDIDLRGLASGWYEIDAVLLKGFVKRSPRRPQSQKDGVEFDLAPMVENQAFSDVTIVRFFFSRFFSRSSFQGACRRFVLISVDFDRFWMTGGEFQHIGSSWLVAAKSSERC
jgi:hypothetical protein